MPDRAARDAAEEASALSHPSVAPDSTASYGEHPDQVVDFYAPRDRDDRVPLVVVLHGGAWRARYDRAHVSPFADFLARHGFAVASVEYRRGPGDPQGASAASGASGASSASGASGASGGGGAAGTGTEGADPVAGRWPETFDDVAAALDALPALAAAHLPQADPRRTVVTGHSAGGHLALWAAARHVLPAGSPWRRTEPPELRGVVALAPIAHFGSAVELDVCGGAVTQLLGGEALSKERAASADPSLLLPTGIATTVVQGRADTVVPAAVAEAYVEAAARAGEMVGLTVLDDVGHFPLIDPAADACAVVAEEIAQLAW
ncbi:alpha/beta hydrolase [Streptomyces fradiae]|uniref:alpha/beta hydrolase n=1 Tax=Streptomyces fradiae TaxID=1906 RepID=UPI00365AAEF7